MVIVHLAVVLNEIFHLLELQFVESSNVQELLSLRSFARVVKGQGAFVEFTPKRKTRKSSFGILSYQFFFFF